MRAIGENDDKKQKDSKTRTEILGSNSSRIARHGFNEADSSTSVASWRYDLQGAGTRNPSPEKTRKRAPKYRVKEPPTQPKTLA